MDEVDPYCWPGSDCLRNKLGVRSAPELAVAEARIVAVRTVQLQRDLIPGEYDLRHLQAFHRYLFRDVYDWAGETRTVNIHKPGVSFCWAQFVDQETRGALRGLTRDRYLISLPADEFLERLAYYYGELNARHPFREGNGRTLRAFLAQLSSAAGWRLDWSRLSAEDNISACRTNMNTAAVAPLIKVLGPVVSQL